jgi:hypothetical protein
MEQMCEAHLGEPPRNVGPRAIGEPSSDPHSATRIAARLLWQRIGLIDRHGLDGVAVSPENEATTDRDRPPAAPR